MSQEMIVEYQGLLTEYSQLYTRASEIRDRIVAMNRELIDQANAIVIPQLQVERVCIYCGSTNYYAKGYCRTCYARYNNNGTPDPKPRRIRPPKQKTKHQLWLEMDWKDRIYSFVFGGKSAPGEEERPADYESGIFYALNTLDQREKDIILWRFKDAVTLEECAGRIGLTRERVRQIEAKAMRKLRRPSVSGYIKNGLEGQKAIDEERRKQKEAEENRIAEEMKKIEEKILEQEKQADIEKADRIKQLVEGTYNPEISDEIVDLSVRAYNVLARAGIKDRKAILSFILEHDGDVDCLFRIRNCGRKTVEEIIKKFHIPYNRPISS